MPKLVANHASLTCSMGSSPSVLTLSRKNKTNCNDQAAATIKDHLPNTNILPFGMCRSLANPQVAAATAAAKGSLTPQPCVPATSSPWSPGSPSVVIANELALDANSTCACQWCGIIKVQDAGQQNTGVA
jgi:hypothetical protein